MFDLIKYAADNKVAIVIDPYESDGVRIVIGTKITRSANETLVKNTQSEAVKPKDVREACDRMLARIGSRKAYHYGNTEQSRKREEMERFWKEGRAIFVSEDQM